MANTRHSYVPFYPSDWLAGTARLPRLHRSAFFDVCCYIWDTAKPVPPLELALMFADLPKWQKIIDDLMAMGKLTINDDGSVQNARALAEAIKSQDLWQRKSEGGRAPKSASKTDPESDASTPPIEPEPEPEPDLEPDGSNPYAGAAWDGWIESRKRKPTDRAIALAIIELTKLKAQGHNPDAVLNQSTMNGWIGLFPLKDRSNGHRTHSGNGQSSSPFVEANLERKAERAAGKQ